ncbi:MAG: hypothetical protein BMS9Abin31_0323 [Gammaproteobacteria bacterium]|nr:MAG: hypothetical protein BMS9Abin31_0323 [Gammaproteobacteria bacterium]
MNETDSNIFAIIFIFIGILLVIYRNRIGHSAAAMYKKSGIDVPEALYSKQFLFVGVIMIIFGFLVGTDLIQYF